MAVIRQQNWLAQQRVDVDHLRAVESAVAGDFDLLAGSILAGKAPLVVAGFKMVSTGVSLASALTLHVADSTLIHFFASESGSIFHVPADRADEVLSSTNPKVSGSFTPSQVNYVGLDLVRSADATTSDQVQFLSADTLVESPRTVPLARTLDYRIVISSNDFESTPGVAPIARVSVDASGQVTQIEDARQIFWRLGSGGTSPNPQSSFSWPAGRKEGAVDADFGGGDKAITSLKNWMDAVMTRLWEVGGGEFWYSPTVDHNLVLARTGSPFVSSGEYFEWSGTNLHWQGLVVVFSNSTGVYNEVANVTGNTPGLTDLADGECIYVDVDRTQTRTISGSNALNAVKAGLAVLGSPTVPGSRWVLAWRRGSSIFVRDQSYAVGSSFKLATIGAAGMVELSATDPGAASPPRVCTLATDILACMAAGLSRTNDFVGGAGDITIGGQGNDHNIQLTLSSSLYGVIASGSNSFNTTARPILSAEDNASFITNPKNRAFHARGTNTSTTQIETAFMVESCGAVGMRNVYNDVVPATPSPTSVDQIRSKLFVRTNGLASPNKRDQICALFFDGQVVTICESNPY